MPSVRNVGTAEKKRVFCGSTNPFTYAAQILSPILDNPLRYKVFPRFFAAAQILSPEAQILSPIRL